jgi:hypothetical protein
MNVKSKIDIISVKSTRKNYFYNFTEGYIFLANLVPLLDGRQVYAYFKTKSKSLKNNI